MSSWDTCCGFHVIGLALLAGCSVGGPGNGNGNGTIIRSSGNGTRTTGSSVGTGTGSGTGGSQADSGCPDPSTFGADLNGCPAGLIEVAGFAQQFCADNFSAARGITVDDANAPTNTVTTDACGLFHLCTQPGSVMEPMVTAPGLVPIVFADIAPASSVELPTDPGLLVMCQDTLTELGGLTGVTIDPSAATVIIEVANIRTSSPYGFLSAGTIDDAGIPCSGRDGWSFTLLDSDGAAVPPDAGFTALYPDGLTPSPGEVLTSWLGVAVFVNVPPSLGRLGVVGQRIGNDLPDGGTLCSFVGDLPPYDVTGALGIIGGYVSFYPFIVGPTGSPNAE